MLPLPQLPRSRRAGAFLIPVMDMLGLLGAFGLGLLVLLWRPEVGLEHFLMWWETGGVHQFYTFVVFSVIAVHTFWLRGQYTRRKPFWAETGEVTRILLAWALLNGVTVLLAKWPFSRTVWLVGWGVGVFFVPVGRLLLKNALLRIGRWQRPTLILGHGDRALDAYTALSGERELGFVILGTVCLKPDRCEPTVSATHGELPLFYATPEELLAWVQRHPRTHIVIALDDAALAEHAALISALGFVMPGLHIAPTTAGLPLVSMESEHFFNHDVLLLRARNNLLNPAALLVKRLTDILGALSFLLMLTPLFMVFVLLIRADGGAALFSQTRVGRDGRLFKCYKFRSMAQNADQLLAELLERDDAAREEFNEFRKLRNDPRITPIGRFLRKTSLDELPQLFNVLRGEMSLVGPRPILPDEMSRFGESLPYYLETRPGMTGLWQVSGRNRLPFSRRVELDVWYVRNWSLWHDVVILLKTVKVVLQRDGAY